MIDNNLLKVALAQISPVWLNKIETRKKIESFIKQAGSNNCDLAVFGEGLLPGYPFWISLTNGAKFNSKVQKEIHAHYIRNAIQIEAGELNNICQIAKKIILLFIWELSKEHKTVVVIVYIVPWFSLIRMVKLDPYTENCNQLMKKD